MTRLKVLTFECPFCGGEYLREHEGIHNHITNECNIVNSSRLVEFHEVSESTRCALVRDGTGQLIDALRVDDNGFEIRFVSNDPADMDEMLQGIANEIARMSAEIDRLDTLTDLIGRARRY